jgi:hypothetical protein
VFVGPAVAIPEHGIESGEHFAHDRDDRDLWLFADPNEATVEGGRRLAVFFASRGNVVGVR